MHYPYQRDSRTPCGCSGTGTDSNSIPVQNQVTPSPFSPGMNQTIQPPEFTMPSPLSPPFMPGQGQPPAPTPSIQNQVTLPPYSPGMNQAIQPPEFTMPSPLSPPFMPDQGQPPAPTPQDIAAPSPYPIPAAPAPQPIPFSAIEQESPAQVIEPAPPSLVRPIDFPLPEGTVIGTQTPAVIPTPPHYLVPGNPLLPEEYKEILSYENMQYLNGFMRTQIGKECLVSLNIGTGGLIASRVGYLIGVGINYFLLQSTCSEEILACDFYSLRMVQFFGKRCPVNLLI